MSINLGQLASSFPFAAGIIPYMEEMLPHEDEIQLSLIVPSFNTAKFIPSYTEKFLNLRCSNEYELIFIDDGSTDGKTGQLLDELCFRFSSFCKVIHKKNGGHGSAINVGVAAAKGRYFKVIDGDDAIPMDSLSDFLLFLKDCDADVVFSDFEHFFVNTGKTSRVSAVRKTAGGAVKEPNLNDFLFQLHSLTYKTTFWKNNNIKVREQVFYEDQEYCVFPIPFIKTFSYFEHPTYIYSIGVPGQSVSFSGYAKHEEDSKLCLEDMLSLFFEELENSNSQNFKLLTKWVAFACAARYRHIILAKEGAERKKLVDDLRLKISRSPLLLAETNAYKIAKYVHLFRGHFLGLVQKRLKRKLSRFNEGLE